MLRNLECLKFFNDIFKAFIIISLRMIRCVKPYFFKSQISISMVEVKLQFFFLFQIQVLNSSLDCLNLDKASLVKKIKLLSEQKHFSDLNRNISFSEQQTSEVMDYFFSNNKSLFCENTFSAKIFWHCTNTWQDKKYA